MSVWTNCDAVKLNHLEYPSRYLKADWYLEEFIILNTEP